MDDDDPQYIVTYEEIGGLRAKLVLPRGEGEGLMTGVDFEDFDIDLDIPSHNRLQMSGLGLTPDQQETALAIFRTIRPLASESQPIDTDDGNTIEPGLGEEGPSTYEGWLSSHQPNQGRVTSIDDIDPNVCNLVHNLNACTAEELDEGGQIEPGVEVEGSIGIEPPIDCGFGEDIYVNSDGEVGCVVAPDLEESGEELVSSSQPPIIEPLRAPATK